MDSRSEYILAEPSVKNELLKLFKEKDSLIIFDIGCCEGEDTIRYSRLFPNSKIYSFELLPANQELSKNNFSKYKVHNAELIDVALSDKEETCDFFVSSGAPENKTYGEDWNYGNKSSSLLAPAQHLEVTPWIKFDNVIKVQTTTLKKFTSKKNIPTIDFIHMDVQGAELKVLKGAEDFIKNIKAIWLEVADIELYKNQPLRNDIQNFMEQNSFYPAKTVLSGNAGDQLYLNTRFFKMNYLIDTGKKMKNKIKSGVKKVLGMNSEYINVGMENERTRNKWIEQTLKKIPSGNRILDAGAGEQPYKKFCSHLKYISQDFAQYKPAEIKNGLQKQNWDYGKLDIVSDVTRIPEPDSSFDAILCTEVIEHIINPSDAIKEFSRLLKKNGQLILTAPFCSMTHFAPHYYYNGFSRYFYEMELKKNNFELIEMTQNGNYFEYLAQEIRRLPSMAEKYCSAVLSKEELQTLDKTLRILEKKSHSDKSSAELLCFGYHIFARKL